MQKPLTVSNMLCIKIPSLTFCLNLKIPHMVFNANHFKRSVHHTYLIIPLENLFHQMHDFKDSYMPRLLQFIHP
jgi:hypothetical protein